jgi:hypothetical protein
LPKKKGCYSAVFKGVEGKLLCLIFNLEVSHQSYRKRKREKFVLKIQSRGWPSILQRDCIRKIILVRGINISLGVIGVSEK